METQIVEPTPLNIELFEKVKAYLREQPLRLDMEDWISTYVGSDEYKPPCNTVCCIAGACLLVSGTVKSESEYLASNISPSTKAKELFGLTSDEANQMFMVSHWPYDLKMEYYRTREKYLTYRERQTAKVELVCQVIDRAIADRELANLTE